MKTLIKYELQKMTNNTSFWGSIIVLMLAVCCVFLSGFYYSQMSLVDKNNSAKGVENLYWTVAEKSAGTFTDERIRNIISDYMEFYQSKPVESRPFDLYSSDIASVFFPTDKDLYIEMNDAVKEGGKVTIDQVKISSIDEIGFTQFKDPLILGNYVPWNDFYKVSGYLFILMAIVSILICSLSFSGDTAKNINQLLLSTKFGRNKLTWAKIKASTMLSLVLYFLIVLISFFVFLIYNHGIAGWDGSIQTNFSLKMFSFPLEINNFEVWLLLILFYAFALLSIVGVTLLISSLTKTPFGSLSISVGLFVLPLALLYIFKTGSINTLLYLFPINNFNVENLLTIMNSGRRFLFSSFIANFLFTIALMLLVKIISDTLIYLKIKNIHKVSS